MPEWRIVLPAVDAEMTDGCVRTIDEDLRDRVILVDNSYRPLRVVGPRAYRGRHNLGVAGSWNLGCRLAREAGASHVVLISASTRFGSGARDVDGLVELMGREGWLALMPRPTYWHTALFDLRFFDEVGTADENFYPAYYEDCDLERRAAILGVAIVDDGQHPDAVLDASTERDGHGTDALREQFPGMATINYDLLQDYWRQKWACGVDDRRDLAQGHRTPFGAEVPPSWWPEVPSVRELQRRYGIAGK